MPCAVDRYLVGKTSPGIINVVVLGPKFWKNWANTKITIKAIMEEFLIWSYANPRITNKIVRIRKPRSWMAFRPILSIKKTVTLKKWMLFYFKFNNSLVVKKVFTNSQVRFPWVQLRRFQRRSWKAHSRHHGNLLLDCHWTRWRSKWCQN